jgi:cytochrome P450 family 144
MQEMEPEFRDLVDKTLDDALPAGQIEWMSELAEPLPMIMVARILGLPDDAAPRLDEQGYASVEAISGFVADEHLEELGRTMMDLGPVVDAYIEALAARQHDLDTLISVCAQAVDVGELTDEEAFTMFFLLRSAGGESTASLTGTGVRILAERPDLQDRLRRHPELSPRSSKRNAGLTRRSEGSSEKSWLTPSSAESGCRGSTLVLVWTAANRDPDAFPHPEEIDLDRPNPRQHVDFGWGMHPCVGVPLARVEAKIAFEQLLARTTSFSVDPASPP